MATIHIFGEQMYINKLYFNDPFEAKEAANDIVKARGGAVKRVSINEYICNDGTHIKLTVQALSKQSPFVILKSRNSMHGNIFESYQ